MRGAVKPGDWVVLARIPAWVGGLAAETRAMFERCLGRAFPVDAIDEDGLLVLDVSFAGFWDEVRVEPECVALRVLSRAG